MLKSIQLRTHVLYVAIISALSLFICNKPKETETIPIIIKIPAKTDTFYVEKPIPIYIGNSIIPKLPITNNIDTCNERYNTLFNFCDSSLKLRVYQNIYNDTNITITVTDTTQGFLNNQKMSYYIKPKTIFTTITTPVKFKNATFVGAGWDFQNSIPSISIGYDTRKYILNYTGNMQSNNITLGIKLNSK